jgi:hypothetical protein
MKRRVLLKTTPFHVKKKKKKKKTERCRFERHCSSFFLPWTCSTEGKKNGFLWLFLFLQTHFLSLSGPHASPTRSPTPLDHRPQTLADHPPRAYPKNRERNLDSCTQMADQPPQPLLPMCNHKKPRPLAL